MRVASGSQRRSRAAPPARGAGRGTFLLALVVLAAIAGWFVYERGRDAVPVAVQAAPAPVTARGDLAADERNNIDVFKRVSPSVVHITTLAAARGFALDAMQVPRGMGSGFIWDQQGHVVTNFHVIEGATGAQVALSDHRTYPATLVGVFPDRDLAVLRIEVPTDKPLQPIMVGESANLEVGQKVYAIGNPFGLDQSLTTGIVSALEREIESVTRRAIRGMIQTDAAINPGNSGGPLLDSAGRLIGVNTAIYSPSGANAGIGFAIPVDEVNRVVPRLIREGRLVRPTLGIQAAPPAVGKPLGLPEGVIVVGVVPGSPAAAAGIRPFTRAADGSLVAGDVITAVDSEKVKSLDNLLEALERRQPGDVVKLAVWRAGTTAEVPAKLGKPE
jgi:S1-C subfamily serine protease